MCVMPHWEIRFDQHQYLNLVNFLLSLLKRPNGNVANAINDHGLKSIVIYHKTIQYPKIIVYHLKQLNNQHYRKMICIGICLHISKQLRIDLYCSRILTIFWRFWKKCWLGNFGKQHRKESCNLTRIIQKYFYSSFRSTALATFHFPFFFFQNEFVRSHAIRNWKDRVWW